MTIEPLEIESDIGSQIDAYGILPAARPHAFNMLALGDDPFCEQIPDGQISVVSGGAHGDGDWSMDAPTVHRAADADFQRLFDRKNVRFDLRLAL